MIGRNLFTSRVTIIQRRRFLLWGRRLLLVAERRQPIGDALFVSQSPDDVLCYRLTKRIEARSLVVILRRELSHVRVVLQSAKQDSDILATHSSASFQTGLKFRPT